MLSEIKLSLKLNPGFKAKALLWANEFDTACYFDSNSYPDPYSAFDVLIGAGEAAQVLATAGNSFEKLQDFLVENAGWALGYLAYDLKNEIEALESENPDSLGFPELHFFVPQHLLLIKGDEILIRSAEPDNVRRDINQQQQLYAPCSLRGQIKSRFTRQEYIETVQKLQQHILRGDIYEVNFCQEFFLENARIEPLAVFNELNKISPTPFATFFKADTRYIISATPERFLSKRADKLISQPIKGTARRSNDRVEDIALKAQLKNDAKEQAENVMIVDLVRNDLTKCAVPGSVKVEELYGVYSFEQVHQMISTVTCKVDERYSPSEILKCAFPMGSMTGAPKVSAMQLIDRYEKTKRGVFSGAVGYFSPDGNFDFNVVIRSLLYNPENNYLSFQVGSAITYDSVPEKEYEECLLKAEAIMQVLTGKEKGAV